MSKRKKSDNNSDKKKNKRSERASRHKQNHNHNHKSANKNSNENSNQGLYSNSQLEDSDVKPALDDSQAKGILKFILKKAIVLAIVLLPFILILGGLLVICMMFMAILGDSDDDSVSAIDNYYLSECDEVNVYFSDTETANVFSLEEYVTDVLYYESNNFNNIEYLKALAVIIRTSVTKQADEDGYCRVSSSKTYESVKNLSTGDSIFVENVRKAVQDTKGIVTLNNDGKLLPFQFDEFCWVSKDSENYILSETQLSQKIPISWVNDNITDDIYKQCPCSVNGNDVTSSPSLCYDIDGVYLVNSSGYGLSKYGAYYLSSLGNSYEEILKFYFADRLKLSSNSNVSFMSIANMEIKLTADAEDLLNKNLGVYLSEKGDSLDNLNSYIYNNVRKAGVGTREGVVAAAVSMINYLYDNHNLKLPYYFGGSQQIYGIGDNIGSLTSPSGMTAESPTRNIKSFDCSGFVSWVIKNGGFKFNRIYSGDFISKFGNNSCVESDSSCYGKPGDVICRNAGGGDTSRHVMIIVGVDSENGVYYIAESTGKGVIISPKSFHEVGRDYKVLFMDDYYSNPENIASDYPN